MKGILLDFYSSLYKDVITVWMSGTYIYAEFIQ